MKKYYSSERDTIFQETKKYQRKENDRKRLRRFSKGMYALQSTGQEHDMNRHYLTKQQKKAQYMSFEKRRTEAGDSSRAYAQVNEMKLSFTKGQNTINHHTSIHDMSL